MMQKYYKIPIDFSKLFHNEMDDYDTRKTSHRYLIKVDSLKRSVDDYIELIIMTHLGEYKHDKDYGFVLWEREFENVEIEKFNTHNNPKHDIEVRLKKTLTKYEPRLRNIDVDILFIYKKMFKGKKIKYFVDITVKGILVNKVDQAYEKSFQFAIGPLVI